MPCRNPKPKTASSTSVSDARVAPLIVSVNSTSAEAPPSTPTNVIDVAGSFVKVPRKATRRPPFSRSLKMVDECAPSREQPSCCGPSDTAPRKTFLATATAAGFRRTRSTTFSFRSSNPSGRSSSTPIPSFETCTTAIEGATATHATSVFVSPFLVVLPVPLVSKLIPDLTG